MGDDDLVQARFGAAADQWVALERPHGLLEKEHHLGCQGRVRSGVEVEDPLEIADRRVRVDYSREGLGFGRFARFPSARLVR